MLWSLGNILKSVLRRCPLSVNRRVHTLLSKKIMEGVMSKVIEIDGERFELVRIRAQHVDDAGATAAGEPYAYALVPGVAGEPLPTEPILNANNGLVLPKE